MEKMKEKNNIETVAEIHAALISELAEIKEQAKEMQSLLKDAQTKLAQQRAYLETLTNPQDELDEEHRREVREYIQQLESLIKNFEDLLEGFGELSEVVEDMEKEVDESIKSKVN